LLAGSASVDVGDDTATLQVVVHVVLPDHADVPE
jgi:hypothetical protein